MRFLMERLMHNIAKRVVSFVKSEDGPTAVEYAVILALFICVCIVAIVVLGDGANDTFSVVSPSTTPSVTP